MANMQIRTLEVCIAILVRFRKEAILRHSEYPNSQNLKSLQDARKSSKAPSVRNYVKPPTESMHVVDLDAPPALKLRLKGLGFRESGRASRNMSRSLPLFTKKKQILEKPRFL